MFASRRKLDNAEKRPHHFSPRTFRVRGLFLSIGLTILRHLTQADTMKPIVIYVEHIPRNPSIWHISFLSTTFHRIFESVIDINLSWLLSSLHPELLSSHRPSFMKSYPPRLLAMHSPQFGMNSSCALSLNTLSSDDSVAAGLPLSLRLCEPTLKGYYSLDKDACKPPSIHGNVSLARHRDIGR